MSITYKLFLLSRAHLHPLVGDEGEVLLPVGLGLLLVLWASVVIQRDLRIAAVGVFVLKIKMLKIVLKVTPR